MIIIEEKDLDEYIKLKNLDIEFLECTNFMESIGLGFVVNQVCKDFFKFIQEELQSMQTQVKPASKKMLKLRQKAMHNIEQEWYKNLVEEIAIRNKALEEDLSRVRTISGGR